MTAPTTTGSQQAGQSWYQQKHSFDLLGTRVKLTAWPGTELTGTVRAIHKSFEGTRAEVEWDNVNQRLLVTQTVDLDDLEPLEQRDLPTPPRFASIEEADAWLDGER